MAKIDNWVHTVKVCGMGSFPIDMLRYDRLTPESETDSGKINRSMQFLGRAEDITEDDPICLMRVTHKNWSPQSRRWESFVWKVVDHEKRPPIS